MDIDAQRRARRSTIKADLARAYTDEEASPPEWVDLLERVTAGARTIRAAITEETSRFAGEPDIRRALAHRDRVAERIRREIVKHNETVTRLNLLAPHSRFTRATLDPEESLRPLYRTPRLTT